MYHRIYNLSMIVGWLVGTISNVGESADMWVG